MQKGRFCNMDRYQSYSSVLSLFCFIYNFYPMNKDTENYIAQLFEEKYDIFHR